MRDRGCNSPLVDEMSLFLRTQEFDHSLQIEIEMARSMVIIR